MTAPFALLRLRRTALAVLGLLLCTAAPALAQTGRVAGTLVDAETGETLIGANVVVDGTTIGTTTDLEGDYDLRGLDAGTYTLVYSYIGYNPKTVQGVEVVAGEVTRLDVSLSSEAIEMGDVVVEARALRNNDATLLRDRQKAAAVSDAISAETISRSGSGDAAAAMTKVTGASVVGGKYVYIRGLGDRYSSTTLNGAALPSADPDRKSFQLDLFPSSLLDNIITTKTFTPDKPGDFSGGLVDVGTKDFPDAFTLQISASSALNTQTSLGDYLSYAGSDTDWLGYDDGLRAIPDVFTQPDLAIPTEIEARRDPELAAVLDRYSRAFDPVMTPTTRTAPLNGSFSAAVGNQIDLAGRPLGFTGSFSYSRSYSAYDNGTVGRYELVGGQVADIEALTPLRFFGDSLGVDVKGDDEVNWGGLATVAYRPHPRHQLSATYLRTQSGVSSARYLSGFWQDLTGSSTFETRVIGYTERSLNSLQFKGKHVVLGGVEAEWRGSFARNLQEEPDLRYFSNHYTVRDRDGVVDTLYQSPASLYPAPIRFFRDLEEQNANGAVDLSIPFRQWSGLAAKVKVGGAYTDVDRTFEQRRFEYREGSGFSYGDFGGDVDAYFAAVGVVDTTGTRFRFGNYVTEATSLKDDYDGTQNVAAAYGMLELPVTRRLRLIGGVRYEATDLETVSRDTTLPRGVLDNDDLLPSVNAVYQLGENMNVRAAYTKTLARPTFRELAPYSTFDFVGDYVFQGNSELKRTLITNYDARWEWFVRPGEILAVSGFYKHFSNPIERVILTSVGNNTLSVQNVDEARVYGLEVEMRKRLDTLTPLLANFQVGGNVSLVQSVVDIPEEELFTIREADPEAGDTRSLQGQSPFLINVDLSYDNLASGTVVGLYYNVFGERLLTVSEGAAPDVFEQPRHDVDLVVSQRLLQDFRLKVQAKNLLDADFRQSQFFKGQEYVYSAYERGRTFSVGITYAL